MSPDIQFKKRKRWFRENVSGRRKRRNQKRTEDKKILDSASPKQLRRVKKIVGRFEGMYGWDSAQHLIQRALRDFDKKKYDSPYIANFIFDEDLELAMSDEEFRITRCGDVTTEPPRKQWDSFGGGWYYD